MSCHVWQTVGSALGFYTSRVLSWAVCGAILRVVHAHTVPGGHLFCLLQTRSRK